MKLVHAQSQEVVVDSLEVADGWWSRFKGLQWRRELPAGRGLLLVPCPSVHTFWMRFAIDVVAIDNTGRILAAFREVRPWRIVTTPRGTHAILEMPAGTSTLTAGDEIQIALDSHQAEIPSSIAFLAPQQTAAENL